MKYINRVFSAVVFSSLFFGVSAPSFAQSACTVNSSGQITDTAPSRSSSECLTQPDEYQITVYKVGLCTAAPTATTSTPMSFANCTTIFENSAGSTVYVNKGQTTALSGTMTRPPAGTYAAGYIEIAPQFNITALKTFSSSRTGSVTGAGSGQYCWSLAGTTYSWSGNVALAQCGNSAGTAGATTTMMNGFNGSNTYTYSATVNSEQIAAYLVDSSYLLPTGGSADNTNNVSKMIGTATFATPVSVTSSSTGFNTSFDITQGSTLVQYNNGLSTNYVAAFFNGPFSILMTVSP